jgi:hypothetical protein
MINKFSGESHIWAIITLVKVVRWPLSANLCTVVTTIVASAAAAMARVKFLMSPLYINWVIVYSRIEQEETLRKPSEPPREGDLPGSSYYSPPP